MSHLFFKMINFYNIFLKKNSFLKLINFQNNY